MVISGLVSFDALLQSMKDKYDRLNKEREELSEALSAYNEEEEIRKRDERIRELEERALYIFSENESRDDDEFRKAHWLSCKNGNSFAYRIAGAGIGSCVTVTCPVCGKSKDITDTSDW